MAAQSWLVLTLTGSATTLGLIVALQTLPILLLGPYGGVIADRVDKRRTMIFLQGMMGLQALVLGVLTITGEVRVWQIGALAAAARRQQRLRESRAPVVHARDGRPRASAQCRQPQLGARQRGAHDRAGRRRPFDRDRRRGRLLPGQRGQLHRGDRFAFDARSAPRSIPARPRGASLGSCARGCATSRAIASWRSRC